jgi:N-acetylmuramic acid 6-phosphate etherase
MLTTGAMVKLGYVFSNLMVNMHPKNEKLVERGILILELLAQVPREVAVAALNKADMSVPVALVMLKGNASKGESAKRLRKAKGNVRKAIEG